MSFNLAWLVSESQSFVEACLGVGRAEGLAGAEAAWILSLQTCVSKGPRLEPGHSFLPALRQEVSIALGKLKNEN